VMKLSAPVSGFTCFARCGVNANGTASAGAQPREIAMRR
jgi:hypothetical protein